MEQKIKLINWLDPKLNHNYEQRKNLEGSIEDAFRGTKEAVTRSSKTEISVIRDLHLKAHPGLIFKDDTGRAIVPADPPSADAVAANAAEKNEKDGAVPPEWAFDEEDESGEEMPAQDLMDAMKSKLPFEDDVEIYRMMRIPGAHGVLASILEELISKDIVRGTSTSEYADNVIKFLFMDKYSDSHRIPDRSEEEETTTAALPQVSKRVLSVVQTLAVKHVGANFNINKFWCQLREHFPEVNRTPMRSPEGKPTATTLYQEAQAAVSEEDQAAKAAKEAPTPAGYMALLRVMKEYRSSGEDSPEAPEVPATQGGPLNVTVDVDPTALETTLGAAVHAQKVEMQTSSRLTHATREHTEYDKHGDRLSRKRTKEAETRKEERVGIKKSKNDVTK